MVEGVLREKCIRICVGYDVWFLVMGKMTLNVFINW